MFGFQLVVKAELQSKRVIYDSRQRYSIMPVVKVHQRSPACAVQGLKAKKVFSPLPVTNFSSHGTVARV
jgi:hypothetical protein